MPVITHVHCVLQYTCPANARVLFPSFGLDACQTQHETRGLHLPTDWKHEWIKTAHDSVPYIFCLPLLSRFCIFPCVSDYSASFPSQRHLSHSQFTSVFSTVFSFMYCLHLLLSYPNNFVPGFYFTCSVYGMIYLLTAIGSSPGGSTHSHANNTQNNTNNNRTTQIINTEQHKYSGRVRAVPRLCEFYPGICLTTEEKTWKNLSQVKKNLSHSTV